MTRSPAEFRALFPALGSNAWFDTPGSPPLADPVRDTLTAALAEWSSGEFDWLQWDGAADRLRSDFARWVGVDEGRVATIASFAEGAACVARGLPSGRVVVGESEFRSNLLPWRMLDPARHELVLVPPRKGALRSEDLADAVDENTVLLAVSEVVSADGVRQDLGLLRRATRQTGTRLLVDATQSMGVLGPFLEADYLIAHGYKWMLCPRGVAFLVASPERFDELLPVAPSWKTRVELGYFGGELELAPDASRCDTSPAWLSWIGARASIALLADLNARDVERRCLSMAETARASAIDHGLAPISPSGFGASHILVVETNDSGRVRQAFDRHSIKATVNPDRFRLGFHYFNDETDLDALVKAFDELVDG